jgi:hypothetical protein
MLYGWGDGLAINDFFSSNENLEKDMDMDDMDMDDMDMVLDLVVK